MKHFDDRCRTPRRDRGFTLVELMIVTVILGILASLALPKVQGVRQKAYDAAAVSDLNAITMAIDLYETMNMVYPTTADVLEPLGYTRTDGVVVTYFQQEEKNGMAGVEVRIEHALSKHWYRIHVPSEGGPEQHPKQP